MLLVNWTLKMRSTPWGGAAYWRRWTDAKLPAPNGRLLPQGQRVALWNAGRTAANGGPGFRPWAGHLERILWQLSLIHISILAFLSFQYFLLPFSSLPSRQFLFAIYLIPKKTIMFLIFFLMMFESISLCEFHFYEIIFYFCESTHLCVSRFLSKWANILLSGCLVSSGPSVA